MRVAASHTPTLPLNNDRRSRWMRAARHWRRPLPLRRWHAIVDFDDEDDGIGGATTTTPCAALALFLSTTSSGTLLAMRRPRDVAQGMTPNVASSSYDCYA